MDYLIVREIIFLGVVNTFGFFKHRKVFTGSAARAFWVVYFENEGRYGNAG